jgi:type II secretory pathway predicted ATPase ExeA
VVSGVASELSTDDWESYWKLEQSPFVERDSAYVPLPPHEEAVARLVHAVENAVSLVELTADAGLGKSTVLRRVLTQIRSPHRRSVLMSCPRERDLLPVLLAERLAAHARREPGRPAAWRAVERAIRVAAIQGIRVVIGIDDCEAASAAVRRDIEWLANLGTGLNVRLTVIPAGRPRRGARMGYDRARALSIGLEPLTRSEVERYLTAKFAAAGRIEPVFSPRGITRLHCLSAGVPASLERLATRCLISGAAHRLALIPPELVDAVPE